MLLDHENIFFSIYRLKMKQQHAKLWHNMDNTEYRNGRRLDQKRSGTDTHATGHQKNLKNSKSKKNVVSLFNHQS